MGASNSPPLHIDIFSQVLKSWRRPTLIGDGRPQTSPAVSGLLRPGKASGTLLALWGPPLAHLFESASFSSTYGAGGGLADSERLLGTAVPGRHRPMRAVRCWPPEAREGFRNFPGLMGACSGPPITKPILPQPLQSWGRPGTALAHGRRPSLVKTGHCWPSQAH
jgi:hypothetical protein